MPLSSLCQWWPSRESSCKPRGLRQCDSVLPALGTWLCVTQGEQGTFLESLPLLQRAYLNKPCSFNLPFLPCSGIRLDIGEILPGKGCRGLARLPRAGAASPPWECSKKKQMWHFVLLFIGNGGAQSKAGFDNPGGLFQPVIPRLGL